MLRSNSLTVPFSGGLQQKGDKRLQNPPALDKCVDAEFDDVGGLRTRKPYAALGVNIQGGGTLSNIRRIVQSGGELLCFTSTGLYSWDANDTAWVSKGTHLAAAVDETQIAVDTTDQYDADMTVFGNAVFYTWYSSANGAVYLAVADATTGAFIVAPFSFGAATIPRLTALGTRVLLTYFVTGFSLTCVSLDPTNLTKAALLASSTVNLAAGSTPAGQYDIKASPDGSKAIVAAILTPTTSYLVATVDASLTVTRSVKARVADVYIAVAVSPDGTKAQILRSNSTAGQGDVLAFPALTDVFTNQAWFSTTPAQLTCCYSTVTVGGFYVAYAFHSYYVNHGDTNNTVSTQVQITTASTVCSQAFDVSGTVYAWYVYNQGTPFSDQRLQSKYQLRDSSAVIHATAAYNIASGNDSRPSSIVPLGGGKYSWATSVKRIVSAGTGLAGYAQRTPRRVDVTFDDNRARRCVRAGRTLYITGGEVRQYDGVQLAEVGFHEAGWLMSVAFLGSGGSIDAGLHPVKYSYRWNNAQGEVERSTCVFVGNTGGSAAANDKLSGTFRSTDATHKGTSIAIEVWRTAKNPTADAPFYLVTSKDPSVSANPNRYLSNDASGTTPTFTDVLADAVLTTKENNPENDGVLENLAPPPATVIAADQLRIYLAGIAGSPNVIWYSKQRAEGEIAAFNDALTIQLPATGGDITALAFLNETLIAFKGTAIYALPGDGFDNTGGGGNYGPPRLLSSDIGATSADTVALTDMGLLFKSSKGWYLLDKGWQVQYVGGPVSDYDVETALAVDVVTSQHQVRIPTGNRAIVWDTLVNQWGEWTIAGAVSSCIWNGTHVYATSSGVFQQRSDFTGVNYGMDIETTWIKPAEPVGQCRVQWLMPLGEVRSTCALRVRIGRNYQQDGSGNWVYFDDNYRTPASTIGGPLQVRIGPSIPWMEAIKVRLTATNAANDPTPPTGEAIKLSAVGIEFGVQPGLFKRLAGAQKA